MTIILVLTRKVHPMTDALISILNTPWTTVLTLASGYAGYFVAHVGLREHHQPVDQTFRVVFYGFWGLFAYVCLRSFIGIDALSASILCVLFAALLGAAWRKWGKKTLTKMLRGGWVSLSDDVPTAWAALADVGEEVHVRQLKVCLIDGTLLFCKDLSAFNREPNLSCVLGGSGDILMHVTDIGKLDANGARVWKEVGGVKNDDFGTAITYIPKEQIARVELRRALKR